MKSNRAVRPLSLALPKPRNPMALAARARAAGVHRAGIGALRQQARLALRSELQQLKHSP